MDPVEHIVARQLTVPLDTPVWLGGAVVRAREYCMVEVRLSGGVTGIGAGFTRGADLAGIVVDRLAPVLKNGCASEIEALWEAMYRAVALNGRQGAFMRALSLVDMALWDAKAKTMGLPLWRVLGGYRPKVPVMMAGGYYGEGKGLDALCEEFQEYAGNGFRRLKLIVGGATMEEDLDRFRAVRGALPDEVALGVDANAAWEDPKAVLRWIRLADETDPGLAFVEEPLPPENPAGLAWLRGNSPVPVAVGEFLAGRWAFHELINRGCADIIRADATLCGGISEWRRIASLCSAASLPLMPHYFASIHLHAALALPGCHCVEEVSTRGRNSSLHLLLGRSYLLEAGDAIPTNAPGIGWEPETEAIEKFTSSKLEHNP